MGKPSTPPSPAKLGGIYPHVGLGVSNKAMSITYNLTSAGKGKALPTLLNPVQAHKQFFAAGTDGDARKDFDADTNLLDFMADDAKRMQARLDGSEKEKLERYLNAFESMSARQGKLGVMAKKIASAAPKSTPKRAGSWKAKPVPPVYSNDWKPSLRSRPVA